MSLDEKIFGGIWKLLPFGKKGKTIFEHEEAILLSTYQKRFSHFASILCGHPIEIVACEDVGGFEGASLYLPKICGFYKSALINYKAYLFRIIFSCTLFLEVKPSDRTFSAIPDDLKNRILTILRAEWPLFLDLYHDIKKTEKIDSTNLAALEHFLYGSHPIRRLAMQLADTGDDADKKTKNITYAIHIKDRPKVAEFSKNQENPLVHSFEKVHTAEEYQGGSKSVDGADDGSMGEALSELSFDTVILTNQTAESNVSVNGGFSFDVEEEVKNVESLVYEKAFHYPEWQSGTSVYKKDWCTVFHNIKPPCIEDDISPQVRFLSRELTQSLSCLVNERVWRKRQKEGIEPDIDALIHYQASLASGHATDTRLYIDRKKFNKNFAFLLLVDSSQSTESWMGNTQLIQLIKDSLLVAHLGLKGASLGAYALASFYSHTRKHCQFDILKNFDGDQGVEPAIHGLSPRGYTRMGPAIRHATYLLGQVEAKKKVLVVMSDCKPTDYDGYEGQYGKQDVYKAVCEAKSQDISFCGFTFSNQAIGGVIDLFGSRNIHVVESLKQFTQQFTHFLQKVGKS